MRPRKPRRPTIGDDAQRFGRVAAFVQLARFDRPIGILLLLWPTMWALWIAGAGQPSFKNVVIFLVGVVTMRAAGCVINDLADREFDQFVKRTRFRPLATGIIKPREAVLYAGGFLLVALIAVLFTSKQTVIWALGGLVLAVIYPFMKRYTHMPQVILGAAFAWSVPMAFSAQAGVVASHAWLVYLSTLLWTVAYDTQYAMIDREDDLKVGIKSTAILFGENDLLMIVLLQALSLLPMLLLGRQLSMSAWYYLGLVIAVCLFAYQYYVARSRRANDCFKAFTHNHWVGLVIFGGIVLHYALGSG